jgi:AmpD protein
LSPPNPPLVIDAATGLLAGARQVLSPHCDARPPGATLELIVIHGISLPPGEFGGPWIDRLFTANVPADAPASLRELIGLRVSAHVLVRRDGALTQYVSFGMRAWHAGHSAYRGRPACNDFSIGIELEGTDSVPYTQAQYEHLTTLAAALIRTYPTLSSTHLARHSDIAPGRKTDPGVAFDWERWQTLLAARLASSTCP